MEFDVDLAQETTSNDLPDETENEMLPNLDNVTSTNVDDGAANTLGRLDDNVVVFSHLKGIEILGPFPRRIQDTFVDSVRDTVIDEFGQDEPVLALVKHLKGICREWKAATDIYIPSKDSIDMPSEFGAFVFVDGMCDVGIRTLHLNLSSKACPGGVPSSALRYGPARCRRHRAGRQAFLCRRGVAEFGNELQKSQPWLRGQKIDGSMRQKR